ncbi:ESCRT-II complex subunit VPS22 [Kwoniella heveanensis CBS 569]|nr:ESCRT-II complex subunit VPS22 [Kwoniella heveanensis CBS 569]
MRKGAGISALSRHTAVSSSYSTLSNTISSNQLSTLQQSLESFRSSLLEFALAHRNDIRADPAFRHQFQKMCAALGVDPLAGSGKGQGKSTLMGGGWWSELVGMGEWEYELAVQVVDVCVSSRQVNGGMIEMGDLIRRVEKLRRGGMGAVSNADTSMNLASTAVSSSSKGKAGNNNVNIGQITPEDILRSLEILKPLKAGYTVHRPSATDASFLGRAQARTYIRTIPRSLDTDQSVLLSIAATTSGRLIPREVRLLTGWTVERVGVALEDCVMREGLGWVDEQADTGTLGGTGVTGSAPTFGRADIWVIAAASFEE